jgi:glycosyltransferase involved in cell wall biosynthesis
MAPAVTVLLPVHRPDLRFLGEAIDSVLAQTWSDWELLIVEDPSDVDADAVFDSRTDARIRRVRRNGPRSLAAALNEGLVLASAPLIARLDSDDVCAPHRLERQVVFLRDSPQIAVVGSSLAIIDEEGHRIGRRDLPGDSSTIAATLRRYNCIAHPSVMFRKRAIESVGGYDTASTIEDYDLWCRLTVAGERLANLEEPLLEYRFHPGALKFESVHRVIRDTIAIKRRYFQQDFTWADRLRIAGELGLLALPPRLILQLFRRIQYRGSAS